MRRTAICTAIVLLTLSVSTAQGGLFEDIYQGLGILATPSGSPVFSSGDGTRVNGQRSGRLRVLPDAVGQGYTLEFDRTFGADSRGRPEVLDLGAIELELLGSTQATFGYTNRGMLIGEGQVLTNNLNYSLRTTSGLQDVEFLGTIAGSAVVEVNQFGFYTVDLDYSNSNARVMIDGVLADGEVDANWDIGPISVQGNIFYDAFVAVLAALGVDTEPLEAVFPASPIDAIVDEIQRQLPPVDLVASELVLSDGQLPPLPALLGDQAQVVAPIDLGPAQMNDAHSTAAWFRSRGR